MKSKGFCMVVMWLVAGGWNTVVRAQQPEPAPAQQTTKPEEKKKVQAPAAANSDQTGQGVQAAPPATGGDDNAFPEAASEAAAKAAAKQQSGDAGLPMEGSQQKPAEPAYSSSRPAGGDDRDVDEPDARGRKGGKKGSGVELEDEGSEGENTGGRNPARAKKDDDIAKFYFQSGNYAGAYSRFKDAIAHDAEDEDAEFGAAESARRLRRNAEAVELYQSYLKHFPDGRKVKEAAKALRDLESAAGKR